MPQDYPATTDVSLRLTDAGMTPPSAARLARATARAKSDWEMGVEWFPFLNLAGAVTTRLYDPPGPRQPGGLFYTRGGGYILSFDSGLLSLTSLTVQGVAYVQNVQFWLWEANAPVMNMPYTSAEFLVSPWGTAQCIAVTGIFGYCQSLPDDVFDAVLARACWLCAGETSGAKSGGMAEFREGQQLERYASGKDVGPWIDVRNDWAAQWNDCLCRYRRSVLCA